MGRSTLESRREKIFGYPASEVVGKPMLMLFPPDRVNEESTFWRASGGARAWNISKPSGCERMARESTFP